MIASVELCIHKLSDVAAKSELKADWERFESELVKRRTLDGLADGVWSGMAFWKGTGRFATDHPDTQIGRQEWMHQLLGRLFP